NVNIDSLLGWQLEGEKHSFMERFDKDNSGDFE
ncbi:MAG: tRNA 2-thiocytidine biosynthesis protein TtcA, partial [Peptostreptococcus sp.]|nr:tRNA 2-thiocytidine biosynthesis protein TtcA [Peptostreptococcus sp.]